MGGWGVRLGVSGVSGLGLQGLGFTGFIGFIGFRVLGSMRLVQMRCKLRRMLAVSWFTDCSSRLRSHLEGVFLSDVG